MGRKNNRRRGSGNKYGDGKGQPIEGGEYNTLADVENMNGTGFQSRMKVEKTPAVQKRITNVGDYPENALIISMGPTNAGKTEYLTKVFGGESVYAYSKMQYMRSIESDTSKEESGWTKKKERYISTLESIIRDKAGERIVVDDTFLDEKFRNRLYKAAKIAGRPVFILNHVVTYEYCEERIEAQYADRKHEPDIDRHKQRSIQRLQTSYQKFLQAVSTIEKELKEQGLIQPEYESQITNIVRVQSDRKNEYKSGEVR